MGSVCGAFELFDGVRLVGIGLRGFLLGIGYGVYYVYMKRWILRFPIIQIWCEFEDSKMDRSHFTNHLRPITTTYGLAYYGCILLCLHGVCVNCASLGHDNIFDVKVLNVGVELRHETLPLEMGHRLYELRGLKASMSYEVKISYPTSTPASFSIQLKNDVHDFRLNTNRRLLNTEKLIFKADSHELLSNHSEIHALVTVEPAGFVAKPVRERKLVIFNIVCEELSLGIPHKAWWVGIMALVCLGLAVAVPNFLPSDLLPNNQSLRSSKQVLQKRPSLHLT